MAWHRQRCMECSTSFEGWKKVSGKTTRSYLTYYVRRITLCGYAVQECDQHTLRFLDKLWERAEGGYPFPHFYKSVVGQLLEGSDGSVAVGLFSALANGQLSLQDAAVMVALNLYGDEGPSQRVKQYLSEVLAEHYLGLESNCKSVLQMNVHMVRLSSRVSRESWVWAYIW